MQLNIEIDSTPAGLARAPRGALVNARLPTNERHVVRRSPKPERPWILSAASRRELVGPLSRRPTVHVGAHRVRAVHHPERLELLQQRLAGPRRLHLVRDADRIVLGAKCVVGPKARVQPVDGVQTIAARARRGAHLERGSHRGRRHGENSNTCEALENPFVVHGVARCSRYAIQNVGKGPARTCLARRATTTVVAERLVADARWPARVSDGDRVTSPTGAGSSVRIQGGTMVSRCSDRAPGASRSSLMLLSSRSRPSVRNVRSPSRWLGDGRVERTLGVHARALLLHPAVEVSIVDEHGEALVTRPYAAPASDNPSTVVARMAADVELR